MKKIVLLNPPFYRICSRDYYNSRMSKDGTQIHPVDFVYLSGEIAEQHQVFFIDAVAQSLNRKKCNFKIKKINPDIIIFLIGFLSYKNDISFIQNLKKTTKALFIGTGDVYRYFKKESFQRNDFLDAIITDFSNAEILKYIQNPGINHLKGMIQKNDNLIINEQTDHSTQFKRKTPKWEYFINKNYYFPFTKKRAFATILTEFGCKYNCKFCQTSSLPYRLRSIPAIMEEVKLLKSLNISEIFFLNQTLGCDKKHLIALCNGLIIEKMNIHWTCFSRADLLNHENIKLMKSAGCHTIMIGIENYNQKLLKTFNRNLSNEHIRNTIDLCKTYKINIIGTFMIGLPGQTIEDMDQTIKHAKSLDLDYASFNLAFPRLGSEFKPSDKLISILLDNNQSFNPKLDSFWETDQTNYPYEIIFKKYRYANFTYYFRFHYLIKKAKNCFHLKMIYTYLKSCYYLFCSLKNKKFHL